MTRIQVTNALRGHPTMIHSKKFCRSWPMTWGVLDLATEVLTIKKVGARRFQHIITSSHIQAPTFVTSSHNTAPNVTINTHHRATSACVALVFALRLTYWRDIPVYIYGLVFWREVCNRRVHGSTLWQRPKIRIWFAGEPSRYIIVLLALTNTHSWSPLLVLQRIFFPFFLFSFFSFFAKMTILCDVRNGFRNSTPFLSVLFESE